ncbi:helix-turn-helix domain-containing protein [Niabella hirudinis]|uniref:helix-turn-helix domain-containing protein n=1 Tax=Niabella hirudinis TaxID=1285929 RepID=UPI003EBF316B
MTSNINVKDKVQPDKSIKAAPFKKEVRVTRPHKHNSYFEIIFLTKGSGQHTIDSQTYEVQPPIVFFVRKEQLHFWSLDAEPDGYVLIIRKNFIEVCLDKEIKTLLYKLSRHSVIHLKDPDRITQLFHLLTLENQEEGPFSQIITEGLLKTLIAKLLQQEPMTVPLTSSGSNLYNTFRELLSLDTQLKNSVAHYAELLNTSPQNLNAACRKYGNTAAADVLGEFLIDEARRLLTYTDNTISEISFQLNFTDASHFVKYFKRHTGTTPAGFRTEHA